MSKRQDYMISKWKSKKDVFQRLPTPQYLLGPTEERFHLLSFLFEIRVICNRLCAISFIGKGKEEKEKEKKGKGEKMGKGKSLCYKSLLNLTESLNNLLPERHLKNGHQFSITILEIK